jgi:hypothetical protein
MEVISQFHASVIFIPVKIFPGHMFEMGFFETRDLAVKFTVFKF